MSTQSFWRKNRVMCLLSCLLLAVFGLLANAPLPAAQAQSASEIVPHLGYGVHWGPNSEANADWVYQLGFEWVKVYTIESAQAFKSKRILYRLDAGWPDNWDAFRNVLVETARVIASQPIDAVEIHNEPNLRNEWAGKTPDAWQYVQVLRVAYQAIKSVKPSLIVVSGGLAPTITTGDRGAISDLEYAREMFENGAGQWFDAFGYHPYGYNMPPEASPNGPQPLVFRRTERIRELMERYGIYKQIWLTEFGWLRDPREDAYPCSDSDPSFSGFAWMRVSGQQQADYLERAFTYAHENWPWAGPMFVWNLNFQQMPWLGACDHMRWFGLLRTDGTPTLAFRRLQSMRRYETDYAPQLVINERNPLRADVAVRCPARVSLGSFSVENIGYPVPVEAAIQPVNGGPVLIEAQPGRVRPGQRVTLFVSAAGVEYPGQYPVYINVRTTINGRPYSQNVQGIVSAWVDASKCP